VLVSSWWRAVEHATGANTMTRHVFYYSTWGFQLSHGAGSLARSPAKGKLGFWPDPARIMVLTP
jgi:hypothetical protein